MHTFKSAALRDQCFEAMGTMSEQELVAGMTGDKAQCQMSWNDGGNTCNVINGNLGSCTRLMCFIETIPRCLRYSDTGH